MARCSGLGESLPWQLNNSVLLSRFSARQLQLQVFEIDRQCIIAHETPVVVPFAVIKNPVGVLGRQIFPDRS